MAAEEPTCPHCGKPLLGRDRFEGQCAACREKEVLGEPSPPEDAELPPEPGTTCPSCGTENPVGPARTGLDWPIEPEGLTQTLLDLRRYERLPPIHITENGCAYPDTVDSPDDARIAFIESHLRALSAAMAAGVDVRGYFYWSLLDNFEWARGYGPRFGLVHVDYATQVRTPKASYHWLRKSLRPT